MIPDIFDGCPKPNGIKLFKRQGAKEFQPTIDLPTHLPECLKAFFVGAFCSARINGWPVSKDWLPRPDRACLLGVIAKGDNEVKVNALEFVPRLAAGAAYINVVLFTKNTQSQWVGSSLGLGACTMGLEATGNDSIGEKFCQNASGRVSRTEEQDLKWWRFGIHI